MKTRLILKPGQKGKKKLVAKYCQRLLCGRYRCDEMLKKRFTTVEIVADERD